MRSPATPCLVAAGTLHPSLPCPRADLTHYGLRTSPAPLRPRLSAAHCYPLRFVAALAEQRSELDDARTARKAAEEEAHTAATEAGRLAEAALATETRAGAVAEELVLARASARGHGAAAARERERLAQQQRDERNAAAAAVEEQRELTRALQRARREGAEASAAAATAEAVGRAARAEAKRLMDELELQETETARHAEAANVHVARSLDSDMKVHHGLALGTLSLFRPYLTSRLLCSP